MSVDFNMSMRKCLKQVGVTSQRAIENAIRKSSAERGISFKENMVLTIDGLDREHIANGKVKG